MVMVMMMISFLQKDKDKLTSYCPSSILVTQDPWVSRSSQTSTYPLFANINKFAFCQLGKCNNALGVILTPQITWIDVGYIYFIFLESRFASFLLMFLLEQLWHILVAHVRNFWSRSILNAPTPLYIDILSKLLPIHDKNLSLQSEPPSQLPRLREKPKHVQGFFSVRKSQSWDEKNIHKS